MNEFEKTQKEFLEELVNIDLFEMAQRQGQDEIFTYYTLDNEYTSHRPHVHLCVKIDDKKWNGDNFKNGQNLKTVASVFLDFNKLKNKEPFTADNLEFETVTDNKILTNKYKSMICNWLNSVSEDEFGNRIAKAIKCYNDYKLSNGNTCIYLRGLENENK